jgi:hypothetical protein
MISTAFSNCFSLNLVMIDDLMRDGCGAISVALCVCHVTVASTIQSLLRSLLGELIRELNRTHTEDYMHCDFLTLITAKRKRGSAFHRLVWT